jgi:hypothetical protein
MRFGWNLFQRKSLRSHTRSVGTCALVVDDKPARFRFDVEADLQQPIQQSYELSREAPLQRCATAPRFPTRVDGTKSVFRRNADVIVEILARAGRRGEWCGMPGHSVVVATVPLILRCTVAAPWGPAGRTQSITPSRCARTAIEVLISMDALGIPTSERLATARCPVENWSSDYQVSSAKSSRDR